MTARAAPSIGRASPAPNIASIDQPGIVERGGRQRLDRPGPARGGCRRIAAQCRRDRRAAPPAPASRARPGCAPRQTRRRHCCPARTAPRPAAAASAARPHRRRRAPAFSISAMPATAAGDRQPVGLAHLPRRQQRAPAANPRRKSSSPRCGMQAARGKARPVPDSVLNGRSDAGDLDGRSVLTAWARTATSSRGGGCSSVG